VSTVTVPVDSDHVQLYCTPVARAPVEKVLTNRTFTYCRPEKSTTVRRYGTTSGSTRLLYSSSTIGRSWYVPVLLVATRYLVLFIPCRLHVHWFKVLYHQRDIILSSHVRNLTALSYCTVHVLYSRRYLKVILNIICNCLPAYSTRASAVTWSDQPSVQKSFQQANYDPINVLSTGSHCKTN